jgi:protein-tyrosine phosphatase
MWMKKRPLPDPELRVLMVCSGNICRSPTAEGVLRAKLQAAGLGGRVVVDSAGTHGFHVSEPPDPRARRHALARGYDLSKQRARQVDRSDFERFDRLLAMDEGHRQWLLDMAPAGLEGRVSMLMAFAVRHAGESEVPDPYYGAAAGFERVLDLVEDACDGLVKSFLNGDGGSPGTS